MMTPSSLDLSKTQSSSTFLSSNGSLSARSLPRGRRTKNWKALSPLEYAKAVRGYSHLPMGAGQNHFSLGEFLTHESALFGTRSLQPFVTLYPLDIHDAASTTHSLSPPPRQKPSDSDADPDSADERRHEARLSLSFKEPDKFFAYSMGRGKPQSCIIFMRGYMSAAWINNIGARYLVDPEFFCRHLDFRPSDDNSNNFSIPALPSSSWHLIELPVITIGTKTAPKGPMRLEVIEQSRRDGNEALKSHHHQISRLSSSPMAVGDSMVRDFFVFDETHFAIEQRISICMQSDRSGKTFSLLIWLDSGSDFSSESSFPWAVQPPTSYFLPIIRHKHMVALKCHLFTSPNADNTEPPLGQDQIASHLPIDYGRSLHPNVMSHDAFYSLNEVFSFAASSQMEFLNLIDIKLDKYTSVSSEVDFQSLPNLKYTKRVLKKQIQKNKRVLDSIHNTQHPKWSKDQSESGSRKAAIAAKNLEQDYTHLLDRAETLHRRTGEAISVLMSSISISESQKAIEQAQRIERLTFLAFIFVPLSFTTSFFGMNVKELKNDVGMKWWAALTLPLAGAAVALFYLDFVTPLRQRIKAIENWRAGSGGFRFKRGAESDDVS